MNWLDIDELLLWCREVDHDDARKTLTALGNAVEINVADYLGRPLFATQKALEQVNPAPEHAMVVNPAIKQAAMMLVSHFNESREVTTDIRLDELPFGFDYLLNPYRIRSHP